MDTSKPAGDFIFRAQAIPEARAVANDCHAPDTEQASVLRTPSLPSFFVIGPPRTGTTWLHQVLGKRTILPGPVKETRFFDVHFQRGLEWYRAHFRRSAGEAVGEVAPTYFASDAARERLAQTIPEARIVCIFRDPVERILSHYRIKRAYGMIPWDFEEAILRDPELVESNKYATHLKEWQRTFGPDQVVATVYDDLRDNPQTFMDNLADVVGMPRFALTEPEAMQVFSSKKMTLPRSYPLTRSATLTAEWCKARRLHSIVWLVKSSPLKKLFLGGGPPFAELSKKVASRLYERFRPEVEQLEAMLNRDLSAWKYSRFERGVKLGETA
jgi:hypothetical protein